MGRFSDGLGKGPNMTTFFSDELIRILLVEDEGVFAMLLTEMLSEGPYEVTRKETLESSLACLREDQIDIVLLDLNLIFAKACQT